MNGIRGPASAKKTSRTRLWRRLSISSREASKHAHAAVDRYMRITESRSEISIVPSQVKVVRHVRRVYAYCHCECNELTRRSSTAAPGRGATSRARSSANWWRLRPKNAVPSGKSRVFRC
ncbi:IS66 family transposase zinc-finger binding domain-containing protein [Paenibacillus sp. BJ-4]|uniref:IS66 family transposase zinc-finger binding domain-containing protein n=1 Tax=Paenibacillus sp. BJ-4 TaxID=2878097 RepID=UPI0039A4E804